MRRAIIIAALAAISLIFVSCTTVEPLALVPVADRDTQNFIQGSTAFSGKAEGNIQMIVGTDNYTGGSLDLLVSIASTNEGTFAFRDDFICLYGGNHEKNDWTLIGKWDSAAFLRDAKKKVTTAHAMAAVAGAIAVVDAILNSDSSSEFVFEFALDAALLHADLAGSSALFYMSADPSMLAAYAILESSIAMSQLSELYNAELKGELLQVPATMNLASVSGKVLFRNLKKYPDYKIVFNNGKQKMDFVYSRTDRQEIIDPWSDKKTPVAAMNYSYTHNLGRHNISFGLFEPSGLGFSTGVSFFPNGDIGASMGLNCKIADYSWLCTSLEVCNLNSIESGADLLGSVGFNVCANMFSLYFGGVYQNREIYCETGVGIAF